jgi:hypothetical protein
VSVRLICPPFEEYFRESEYDYENACDVYFSTKFDELLYIATEMDNTLGCELRCAVSLWHDTASVCPDMSDAIRLEHFRWGQCKLYVSYIIQQVSIRSRSHLVQSVHSESTGTRLSEQTS